MIPCLTTARLLTLKYYDIVVCSNLQLFVVVCIYLKPDGIVRLFLLGVVGLADTVGGYDTKQKPRSALPQRVRIVATFLFFDFGAFNHGQIFILLFF